MVDLQARIASIITWSEHRRRVFQVGPKYNYDMYLEDIWRTRHFVEGFYEYSTPAIDNPIDDDSSACYEIFETDDYMNGRPQFVLEKGVEFMDTLHKRRISSVQDLNEDSKDVTVGRKSKGAILAIELRSSDQCGAASPETGGILDDSDMPPWDWWIDLIEITSDYRGDILVPFLISWIPEEFVELVEDGLNVVPIISAHWMNEENELMIQNQIQKWDSIQLLEI